MSLLASEETDAILIPVVLLLNAVIGTAQEWKAEQSARVLQKLIRGQATVRRDRETQELDAEEIVPGDIVWMESGNRVPADLRLLGTTGLQIDESLLTGESLAVLKDAEWQGSPEVSLGDRQNMASAGSILAGGRGWGVVVASGARTRCGRTGRGCGQSRGRNRRS